MRLMTGSVRTVGCGALGLTLVFGLFAAPAVAADSGGADPGLVDPNAVPLTNPEPVGPSRVARPLPRRTPLNTVTPQAPGQAVVAPTTQPIPSGPQPRAVAKETTINFGKHIGSKPVEFTIRLENQGDAELKIENVHPGCGCTVMANWAKTVPIGGSWSATGTINVGMAKTHLTKTVDVTTNDPRNRTIRFTITGEVIPRFEVKPAASINFARMQRNAPAVQALTITNQLTETPTIVKSAKADVSWMAVEVKEVEKGKTYEVIATAAPPYPQDQQQLRGKVTLETDNKDEPTIDLPVYGFVPPRLQLTPLFVPIPSPVEANPELKKALTLRNEGDTPITVTDVTVSDPAIAHEVTTIDDGKAHQIWLTLKKGLVVPPTGVTVTIKTNDAQYPTFTARLTPMNIRAARPQPTSQPTTRPAAMTFTPKTK